MTDQVDYLDLDDVLACARAALGRPPQARDWGLIASALARPRASALGNEAYPDVVTKAAALLSSLITNRALVDGNKRMALVATRLFLGLNGVPVVASDDEKFDLVLDIAEGRLRSAAEVADRLRPLTRSARQRPVAVP